MTNNICKIQNNTKIYCECTMTCIAGKTLLGPRLKALRLNKGLTQLELGRAVGRLQQVISLWESSKMHIRADDLPGLAKALDVPIEAFFDEAWDSAATPVTVGPQEPRSFRC
jgi:transcriptional regulator with XRE-family HTH domain